MKLAESGEMYIESIYVLSKKQPTVRAVEVADYLGYSKPSVSRAIGLLKRGGYVVTDESGYLTLTEKGLQVAIKTYERHIVLSNYFVSLGVDKQVADEDACKIEHVISDETFQAIKKNFKL